MEMESQTKPTAGFDGVHAVTTPNAYPPAPPAAQPSSFLRLAGYILRFKALLLTLVATIVMGVAKETVTGTVVDDSTGLVEVLSATVKSTYSAAFVYFIVANVLVFVYSSISLALSIVGKDRFELPVAVGDLLMVVFLYSSNGAAAAIDIILEKGQSRLGWDSICDDVGKFCSHVKGSVVLSMAASLAYVLLVLLAFISFHKKSQRKF